jgi:hypothetical protein
LGDGGAMSEAEQIEPIKKKKRKYTRRGPYKITLDGKSYQGMEIRREGKFLVLKTAKGSVMVNIETARTPIEIIGEIAVQTLTAPVAAPAGSPQASGLAVNFAARRKQNLEGMLSMPSGLEPPED